MLKELIIAFHSLLVAGPMYAQQNVLGNAGTSSTAIAGFTIDYTVGEAVITTIGSAPVLTQGFHQPLLNNVPVPVRLLFFTARGQNGQSLLQWRTATEINNRLFVIERSENGLQYTVLDSMNSKAPDGNSSWPLDYTYTDNRPLLRNFYRIRQVDHNGQYSYSPIAIVGFDAANQWILYTYPNPVQQQLNLVIYSGEATVANCTITNVTGRLVHRQQLTLNKGNNRFTMPVQGLPAGMFFVRVENMAWSSISKFVKQ